MGIGGRAGLSARGNAFHKPSMTGTVPPARGAGQEPRPAEPKTPAPNGRPEIASLPFERAIEELEGIVQRLEQGNVALDESVAIYERGEALKRHCEALLQRAEARIQKITLGPDGAPSGTAPLDPT